ncbi:WD40 repeat-like protein [Fragilariopsis cylindrus CCMP1102]|uniref:WD40 repeat-like protein n=1 Tax=Fragilariopsis cylindrus CCMP1102 TaxID=635003 RepID=A0A1E7FRG5_9STRA|nr:WD40 repeat-like protein [Fragilariopsis cylindrus CCMP1102]|eukprot:OEU20738.1 WD40 repeat-like protein [Fragilariopsis cylindrus CCMP1102]
MTDLIRLILDRNARETIPFVAIHDSNTILSKEVDAWHSKCEDLEREIVVHQEALEEIQQRVKVVLHYAESAALKNERKLMEKLEHIQSQVKDQDERHLKDTERESIENATKSRDEFRDLYKSQERNLSMLHRENEQQERALEHLTNKVSDGEQRTKLAEQQYTGLKDTIRILQEENYILKKENRQFEARFIDEKDRLSSEVNSLNETVEQLKRETDMLRSLRKQEEKRKSWFGLAGSTKEATNKSNNSTSSTSSTSRRKFGSLSIVVPSEPKQIIQAHRKEAVCVRYDDAGTDLATGGSDGTVKIWNTSNSSVIATLKGGSSNSIISCDVTNHFVAGGGSDKTVRVWNIKSQRMVHQLVGHANKITSVRFLGTAKGIITASADRQMIVWDISKQTYRQTTNISLNSTANSIDVADDSYTVVSGHVDGGLRLWDIRTAQKSAEIENVHESAITSVQLNPLDSSKIMTNGMDSRIKIVDIRTCKAIHEFSHGDFQTSYNWSSSVFSPDGAYVASGSSSNGFIFVWNAKNGKLIRKLECGHNDTGVCGLAWGRGGNNGQQVATVDKSGRLVLWS